MSTHITGIDHTLIGVRDLEAARRAYERLGFTITPRGRHKGWGTANYCAMFQDDYVELLGIVDSSQFTNNLDGFLETREGLMAVALQTDDAEATKAALDERGIAARGPEDLSRLLELPGGDAEPAFKLVFPGEEAVPGLSAFVVQHLTPDMIRRPEWLEHPNGAIGIASMTVLVDRPVDLEEAYQNLFGTRHVIETDNTLVVRVGAARILFCNPDDLGMLHPEAPDIDPAHLPMPLAMTLVSNDVGMTVDYFANAGVKHRVLADGTVAVPPSETHGVLLEFRPPD